MMIEEEMLPCVRIFSTTFTLAGALKYKFPGEISVPMLHQFLRAYRSGDVLPYLKMEKLEKENFGNVKLLNSISFQPNILV